MKVADGQIFNLMDTNGRRNDVINALQGYLTVLDNVQNEQKMEWASMPDSLAQYEFYRQALELSPEVFRQHQPYDRLLDELEKYPDFKNAVENGDLDWIKSNRRKYGGLIKQFDKGVEDRARHYTSNLVKLGFADKGRKLSPAGELLLDLKKIKKDALERLLPIDGVNIVYLRQLLKLRIFSSDGKRYYSPFHLALFALLKRPRFAEDEFLELVQGFNPSVGVPDLEFYVLHYRAGDIADGIPVLVPDSLKQGGKMTEEEFRNHFKNRKSGTGVDIYWDFYDALWNFAADRSESGLDKLLTCYKGSREMLDKAFGRGKRLFRYQAEERPAVERFLSENGEMFTSDLNQDLYARFSLSKTLDQIREYSDTTKRIFKATGIISFDSGFVELAYRELCVCLLDEAKIREQAAGNVEEVSCPHGASYEEYEEGVNSYFCGVTQLSRILGYTESEICRIEANVRKEFAGAPIDRIPAIVADKRGKEFAAFIRKNYPADKVKEILALFGDRSRDNEIQRLVSTDATVPTIYEYMTGIAWYYFSGEKINLLDSYNLTLSADFEPLVHAGGGQGDIVIREKDKVVMLEATLMNAGNQKRGEWEPVLRHAINLKVEEETAGTGREVTTFFIADHFDSNTINIWKAVAAVPLQSSVDKGKFTDNVVIMPVRTDELAALMDRHEEYDAVISSVHRLFEAEKTKFDMKWRENFMEEIL